MYERLGSMAEAEYCKKQVPAKVMPRNVIGIISGKSSAVEKVNQFDADKYIKQCQERLKTDPNYKQSDYEMDFVRCKRLKMPPNHVQNVKPSDVRNNDERSKIMHINNIDDDHDDDDFIDFFDLCSTANNNNNHNYSGNFHQFSPDSSMDLMDLMNLATPESHSSFFFE